MIKSLDCVNMLLKISRIEMTSAGLKEQAIWLILYFVSKCNYQYFNYQKKVFENELIMCFFWGKIDIKVVVECNPFFNYVFSLFLKKHASWNTLQIKITLFMYVCMYVWVWQINWIIHQEVKLFKDIKIFNDVLSYFVKI